jgi:hypothetical protein
VALLQDFAREAATITDQISAASAATPRQLAILLIFMCLLHVAALGTQHDFNQACFGLAEGRKCSYRWFHRNRRI